MLLAHENEAEGRNLYQLMQAMGRFLPLLPRSSQSGDLAAAARRRRRRQKSAANS